MTVPFAVFLINPFAVFLPVSSMLPFDVRFIDFRSVVMTIASLVLNRVSGGKNVAEFEDEFEPEFDDRFVVESVAGSVAGSAYRPQHRSDSA